MTGWNLPPGVNVGDIPGNRPEDEAEEKAYERMAEEMDGALTTYEVNYGCDNLQAVSSWVEETFKGWSVVGDRELKRLRTLERAEQRSVMGNNALNKLEAEGG